MDRGAEQDGRPCNWSNLNYYQSNGAFKLDFSLHSLFALFLQCMPATQSAVQYTVHPRNLHKTICGCVWIRSNDDNEEEDVLNLLFFVHHFPHVHTANPYLWCVSNNKQSEWVVGGWLNEGGGEKRESIIISEWTLKLISLITFDKIKLHVIITSVIWHGN